MSKELKAELQKKIRGQEKAIISSRGLGNDTKEMESKLQAWKLELEELLEDMGEETDKKKRLKERKDQREAIQNAISAYDKGLCIHLGSQTRYFYKKTIVDTHRITKKPLPETSLTFFSFTQLYPHFAEMESKLAQSYLRKIIEGQVVECPVEGSDTEYDQIQLEPRVYKKLGNTRHVPGPENYNLLDLSGIMKPSGTVVKACPKILRALMMSLTGNKRTWEQDHWEYTKEESMLWLEKWIYGAICADIGNPFLGMPVIFGAGKVGKNALFDVILPAMLGTHLCFSATWSTIDGNFNAFKVGKVFTFIDEVPSRDDWDKLKNLTGSPVSYVKEKYGPEFIIENTVANVIGSNETVYPLPLEDGKQMTRVSPIEVYKDSTFACNVVELLGQLEVATKLLEAGVDITGFDDYELGDTYLKTFTDAWSGKEVLQEFLDYLHTTYGQGTYNLQPLRGKDWRKITNGKKSYLEQTAEYIIERNPEYITLPEVFEIYKVISGDTTGNYQKKSGNVSIQIAPYLEEVGYITAQQVRVRVHSGGATTQTRVFHKPEANLKDVHQEHTRYIFEEVVGTKTLRHLKYEEMHSSSASADTTGSFGLV